MIDRIAQGLQAQLRVHLYVDGELTNPVGDTTIEVVRKDGTVLVPAGTTTVAVATGVKGYTLTPADTEDLDILEARWTAEDLDGEDQVFKTHVEVVGGFFFTVAEAQAGAFGVPSMANFSVDEIVAARTMAEQAIEEECGAFVPHYKRETFSGDSSLYYGDLGDLLIVRERISRIVSVSFGGDALDSGELAALRPDRDDIYSPTGWPEGRDNVEIVYEHDFKQVPALVKRAAMLLARRYLEELPIDSRTTRVTQEGATIEFQVDPTLPFDVPEVDAIVKRYGRKATRLT